METKTKTKTSSQEEKGMETKTFNSKRPMSRSLRVRMLKLQFIEVLAETGNTTIAAKAVGISKSTAYKYRNEDDEFMRQWKDALEVADDKLLEEARRRAIDGEDRHVYYGGKLINVEKTYSDGLLSKLLTFASKRREENAMERIEMRLERHRKRERQRLKQEVLSELKSVGKDKNHE